jgi:hypothetical protein
MRFLGRSIAQTSIAHVLDLLKHEKDRCKHTERLPDKVVATLRRKDGVYCSYSPVRAGYETRQHQHRRK